MNFLVRRLVCQHGSKGLKRYSKSFIRLTSNDGPCNSGSSKQEPCPAPKADPAPPKIDCNYPKGETLKSEPCVAEPPPHPCSDPCPPTPPCNPPPCPGYDPNHPCNYTPPTDPEEPDLSRLKRLQCKFQEDNGLPIFLKGGKFDGVLYHATVILVIFSVLSTLYSIFKCA